MYYPKRMLQQALQQYLPLSPAASAGNHDTSDSNDIARLMRQSPEFAKVVNNILVTAIRDQGFVTQLLEDRAWWRPLLTMTEGYDERTRLYATPPFSWQKNVELSYSVHPFLQGCAFQIYESVDDTTLDIHVHSLRVAHRELDRACHMASLLDQQARNGIAQRLRAFESGPSSVDQHRTAPVRRKWSYRV